MPRKQNFDFFRKIEILKAIFYSVAQFSKKKCIYLLVYTLVKTWQNLKEVIFVLRKIFSLKKAHFARVAGISNINHSTCCRETLKSLNTGKMHSIKYRRIKILLPSTTST